MHNEVQSIIFKAGSRAKSQRGCKISRGVHFFNLLFNLTIARRRQKFFKDCMSYVLVGKEVL